MTTYALGPWHDSVSDGTERVVMVHDQVILLSASATAVTAALDDGCSTADQVTEWLGVRFDDAPDVATVDTVLHQLLPYGVVVHG